MPLINSLEIENQPIGFFDSGVGGLPYLSLAQEILPKERYIYVADTKNFPYGDKSPRILKHVIKQVITDVVRKFNPKCMVIACNTASVVALKELRSMFPIPFIGVVPAVKPAALFSEKKKIGVLATLRTVKAEYLRQLIADFANGCEVTIVPAGSIRDLVEQRFFSATGEEKKTLLEDVVKELKVRGVDSVVLGCTHFLHLVDEFKVVLGDNISVIDSRKGVINQLNRILQKNNLYARSKTGQDSFYITGKMENPEMYRQFSEQYNLIFSGTL
ncbi:MAG: glutamate racemase [Spirochaetales bacterium]|nr:glutamate racemase [Spirochaetales bacterium]